MHNRPWARQRVKLQHLRVVLAVAGNASLLKASEQVGLSQPAISKILQEMEEALGVRLFERTSRGTRCTPYGDILVAHARLVMAQLERAEEEIRDVGAGMLGRVVVGTLIAGAASVLPLAVARLHAQRPGVRVTIIEGTYDYLAPLLRQGGLDLIVGRLPAPRYRAGLKVEALFQEQIAFVVRVGHPALALDSPSLGELRRWPWILPLPDTLLRQMLEAAFQEQQLELPQAPCESVSVVSNRRLIMHTDYVCAFPWRVVAPDVRGGLLARLPVMPVPSFGPVGVSRRKDAPLSRVALALMDALRDVAALDEGGGE